MLFYYDTKFLALKAIKKLDEKFWRYILMFPHAPDFLYKYSNIIKYITNHYKIAIKKI